MKFKKGTRRKAIDYEKDLVKYWKEHKTFEKSVEQRPAGNSYVFYDGPPFITGVPHHGTLLSSIVKDAVPRYWTMQGRRVERVWGWDCHGLPAEVYTEKKLGIADKRDIGTKISLEEYIITCRENMVQTGNAWEDTIDRVGRWVDFKGAYKTMDKNYMESVWWAFKKLYEEGKIYEGEKVLMYCVRDATPISKAEVAMDNSYKDVTDPSVYVKFELEEESVGESTRKLGLPVYMLAWTTTPWTLPANTGLAVNPRINYSEVRVGNEIYILAKDLLSKVLVDDKHKPIEYETLHEFTGERLLSRERHYKPLFGNRGQNAHKIWAADYVTTEDGSGVVHLAPAYGEEDYALAKEHGIPIVNYIDDNGFFKDGEWKGEYVWDINKPIAKILHERGVVWKIGYITHSYPHCHRCGTKLMYRAHPSWFMNIAGQRTEMLEQNGPINWFPEHIKKGRFTKTVESAPDWNLSRDRFWATAIPVWKGKDSEGNIRIKVVGSYAELKELSGVELEDYHRPWIDDVTFEIDGVEYKRIDKVMDSWFEAGSMPFAQFHYPFENVEKFEQNFPGDFIAEYVGQVRAWFYYLHALSVGLWGKNTFNNVIVTGTLAGNDGRKMSKSYGNYTDPNELMDMYSADALRLYLLNSPVLNAEDVSLQDKEVADVARKLSMIWNMYDFFTLYADVDGWEWDGSLDDPSESLTNPLDEWIVSRVHQLNKHVTDNMSRYDIPNALKSVLPFIDDASNWYVRRSRKRFWKSDNDGDKQAAYRTLDYVLVQLSIILAPFTPFLAEELYQKLTGGESVHLLDWPAPGHVNELMIGDMSEIRDAITQALALRAQAGIKVRQPLNLLKISANRTWLPEHTEFYKSILEEEVNVKNVAFNDQGEGSVGVELDLELTPELKREGHMREIIRNIQSARKQANLEVDDRIRLSLSTTDDELQQVLQDEKLMLIVRQETLTSELADNLDDGFSTTVKIDGADISINLAKA